jgi:hypothetical protein
VHTVLRQILTARGDAISDRLAACAALITRLIKGRGVPAREVLHGAVRDGPKALALEARRGGRRATGRRALALYLLRDHEAASRLGFLMRLLAVILFTSGRTRLTARSVASRASWAEARRVSFQPTASANALLTRYFTEKLESRRHLAGDATLTGGVNLLVAAFGMAVVLARMRAAASGRQVCDDDDIRMGVQGAELLVVEHAGFSRSFVHQTLAATVLEDPALAGGVLSHLHL